MNSKLKKASIALAGVMSAVAIASAVPMGTGASLGSVATVAHAANNWSDDINSDTVFSGDTEIQMDAVPYVGNNEQCVIIIDGNLTLDDGYYEWEDFGDGEEDMGVDGGAVYVFDGSSVIVTGNLICGVKSKVDGYSSGKIIVGGTITNNGGNIAGVSASSLPGLGYVAENADHYAYFTSNGQGYYTYNGSDFVATTEAAVSKSKPATVTYAQVGSDYTSETEFDNTASLWKVTVTAGSESIEKIDVKLDSIASEEGEQTLETPIVTDAQIVLGVVTNLTGAEVNEMGGFTVMVNGEAL